MANFNQHFRTTKNLFFNYQTLVEIENKLLNFLKGLKLEYYTKNKKIEVCYVSKKLKIACVDIFLIMNQNFNYSCVLKMRRGQPGAFEEFSSLLKGGVIVPIEDDEKKYHWATPLWVDSDVIGLFSKGDSIHYFIKLFMDETDPENIFYLTKIIKKLKKEEDVQSVFYDKIATMLKQCKEEDRCLVNLVCKELKMN
jgi:hypothetical protein